jgi:hypothetical protein
LIVPLNTIEIPLIRLKKRYSMNTLENPWAMMSSLVEWMCARPDKQSGQLWRGVRAGGHPDSPMAHYKAAPATDLASAGLSGNGARVGLSDNGGHADPAAPRRIQRRWQRVNGLIGPYGWAWQPADGLAIFLIFLIH